MTDFVLGIETSCDDTAIALVDRDGNVAGAKTVAQFDIHAEFGGVYPELASRAHLEAILPTVDSVLGATGVLLADIKAIGVTRGPGLIGSLLVGLSTVQALSFAWGKPAIGINHLRGHLRSVDLEEKRLTYPALVLLVSGGHTLLAYSKDKWSFELLGTTRDDSVGESYDKVARMLGLGMPGGPAVDICAKQGNPAIRFPKPMIKEGYEFSFSGLKSSVARHLENNPDFDVNDVSASFVASCLAVLSTKVTRAIKEYKPASFAVVGGVAASPQVRQAMQDIATKEGVCLCLPPLKWATDNAAMIALATWDYLDQDIQTGLEPKPNLRLGDA
ncbi:tRNA (adenosine(37)-N6)-threonylcarbamoyltransferase complex transferase subunit TsaD [Yoonia sediminilitoris]|uniref:tRNA N6-adenosine threonylcarbamoyltransferase n=1 Tax=Yoonia sediminilitoris TaxID=1286148 RepID=A0A2T6KAF8_9RHOB|nr:tRNA (adenosine(37)-N6)-threonylcarbamoyltransferase complex transferase subunit TsaD [Yoonia sediminilitoris]PUB11830.1 N6-L-threonylcarbamoyladenine synthase [Yoonia sediminilitoris]RCW91907.1 N6-L-threonylcarbamoyladenine synthase [Yoonia sediminilitoris]